jgi:hypothetical protein
MKHDEPAEDSLRQDDAPAPATPHDPRDRRTRGRWFATLLRVGGTSGVLAVAGLVGLWWYVSNKERVGNPAAPRGLPRKYFAYLPPGPATVFVTDEEARLPETGRASAPLDIVLIGGANAPAAS